MYDSPSTLAVTGAGVTILGSTFDVSWVLLAAAVLVTGGILLFVRSRGKRANIL